MPEPLRISRLQFKAPGRNGQLLDLDPGRILIFVGPNNSGKSLALRELESWSSGADEARRVLAEIGAVFPSTLEGALDHLAPVATDAPAGQAAEPDTRWFYASDLSAHRGSSRNTGAYAVRESELETYVRDPASYSVALRSWLLRPLTARLDGHTRFDLTNNRPCGDLQQPSENHLGALFRSDEHRSRVRELTGEAFRFGPRYFVIEYVGDGELRARLSPSKPADAQEEQGITQRSRDFHAAAVPIADQGDGVRAFCGLVAALVSLPQRTMLVDEPEAFLHPTLARRLGNNLASLASERDTTLLAATHSPEFLMGCLDAGGPVTVVRLTYDPGSNEASAKDLPAEDLRALMSDPLLRSTGALDGLFHRAVVVGEADADRAFYDEVNHRLEAIGQGVTDCLFSNAQNWQTVARIIAPLRRLGIPAAGILDLDAITVSGPEWGRMFDAVLVDNSTRARLQGELDKARQDLRALGATKPHKKRGIAALKGQAKRNVEDFVASMSELGVFLVPVGELEGWLAEFGVEEPKPNWIVEMFGRLGDDPESERYARPGSNDVWAFVNAIGAWTDNPKRLGVS
jgi:hypothetical protein